jgi:hypothetical protein
MDARGDGGQAMPSGAVAAWTALSVVYFAPLLTRWLWLDTSRGFRRWPA